MATTEDSYNCCITYLDKDMTTLSSKSNMWPICISIKGRKSYPIMDKLFTLFLNGDYLSWNAKFSYEHKALNIQYGNGAFIVVWEC